MQWFISCWTTPHNQMTMLQMGVCSFTLMVAVGIPYFIWFDRQDKKWRK